MIWEGYHGIYRAMGCQGCNRQAPDGVWWIWCRHCGEKHIQWEKHILIQVSEWPMQIEDILNLMAIAKPMGNDSSFLGFRNSKLRRKASLKHLNFWSWFGFGASEVPNLLHMFWSVLGEALNVQAKYWRFSVWMPENCFISVCDMCCML